MNIAELSDLLTWMESVGFSQRDLNSERMREIAKCARAASAAPAMTEEQRESIEYAQQVLRQVEAGDGTFVGQCSAAISGLDSVLASAAPAEGRQAVVKVRVTHLGHHAEIESYVARSLPMGVHALYAIPQREAVDERAAFEKALKDTYQMVDVLKPPPAGTYYRGQHDGIIEALKTIRENFDRAALATAPTMSEAASTSPIVQWQFRKYEGGCWSDWANCWRSMVEQYEENPIFEFRGLAVVNRIRGADSKATLNAE